MKNISLRKHEFIEGGSTLGYLLAYTAMYIWFFKVLRNNKTSLFFFFFITITILIRISTGRILQSITYIASFIVIYYFVNISKNKRVNNFYYIFSSIIFSIFAVIIYFLRVLSSYSMVSNFRVSNIKDLFLNDFLINFGYFAAGKGNIPNIPILMQIIDRWAKDVGFLYGKSFFNPLIIFLPSTLRPENIDPSLGKIIKETWYLGIPGGELPPTGIGEMYINFGIIGPFIGMFIFGVLCALIYNLMLKSKSYWMLAIYSQILIGFIMIYPKGEFSNLTLWYVLPIAITIGFMKLIIISSAYYKKIPK